MVIRLAKLCSFVEEIPRESSALCSAVEVPRSQHKQDDVRG